MRESPYTEDREDRAPDRTSAFTNADPLMLGYTLPSRTVTFLQTRCPQCFPASRLGLREACRRHRDTPVSRWFRCRMENGHRPCPDRAQNSCCSLPLVATEQTAQCDQSPCPSSPAIPLSRSALRIAHVKVVKLVHIRQASNPSCGLRTRKNQFPPQATSPRTSPYPGTFTATSAALR